MILDVVTYMKSQLLYYMPEYNEALALARKDETGKVIIKDDTDYKWAGISDMGGNYFYMRYLEAEGSKYSEESQKFGSCSTTTRVETRIRLVSIINDPSQCGQADKHAQEENIRTALGRVNFLGYTGTEHRIRAHMTSSLQDPVKIMKEETGGKARSFSNDWLFNVVDFTITFLDIVGSGTSSGSKLVGGVPPSGPEECCDSLVIDQLSPAATWNHVHNLGKYPSVQVVGLDWKTIDQPLIHFIDNNTVAISFDEPFTGRTIFN